MNEKTNIVKMTKRDNTTIPQFLGNNLIIPGDLFAEAFTAMMKDMGRSTQAKQTPKTNNNGN